MTYLLRFGLELRPDQSLHEPLTDLADRLRSHVPELADSIPDGPGWQWIRARMTPERRASISDIESVEFADTCPVRRGVVIALRGTPAELAGAADALAQAGHGWRRGDLPYGDASLQVQVRSV